MEVVIPSADGGGIEMSVIRVFERGDLSDAMMDHP
jgi:hypothetical protein